MTPFRLLLTATLLTPAYALADDTGWEAGWSGYVRAGFEAVQDDPDIDYIGDHDGFILHNARLNYAAKNEKSGVSFRAGVEGAADLGNDLNDPQSELGVRLRDAYVRWDPSKYLGVQVGQFKAPFAAEELLSTADLRFVGRSVGIDGAAVGRAFEEDGLGVDRQMGVMLSPDEHIRFGGLGVGYYLMAANGNGANQALDDNGKPAWYARLELSWEKMLTVGAGMYRNERALHSRGTTQIVETTNTGMAGDLMFRLMGIEVFAQFAQVKEEHDTVTVNPERTSRSLSGQIAYTIEGLPVGLTPAYRFAQFEPFTDGDERADFTSRKIQYHTVGLRVDHPDTALSLHLNYTLTGEESARELENNRFEAVAQMVF